MIGLVSLNFDAKIQTTELGYDIAGDMWEQGWI